MRSTRPVYGHRPRHTTVAIAAVLSAAVLTCSPAAALTCPAGEHGDDCANCPFPDRCLAGGNCTEGSSGYLCAHCNTAVRTCPQGLLHDHHDGSWCQCGNRTDGVCAYSWRAVRAVHSGAHYELGGKCLPCGANDNGDSHSMAGATFAQLMVAGTVSGAVAWFLSAHMHRTLPPTAAARTARTAEATSVPRVPALALILIPFVQLALTVLAVRSFRWPANVSKSVSIASTYSFVELTGVECSGGSGDQLALTKFLVAQALFPALVLAFVFVGVMARVMRRPRTQYRAANTIACAHSLLLVVIVKQCLKFFVNGTIDGRARPQTSIGVTGAVYVVFVAVLLPLCFSLRLGYASRTIAYWVDDSTKGDKILLSRERWSEPFMRSYGTLYMKYYAACCHSEVLMSCRKAALVSLAVFQADSAEWCALLSGAVLLLALAFLCVHRPFNVSHEFHEIALNAVTALSPRSRMTRRSPAPDHREKLTALYLVSIVVLTFVFAAFGLFVAFGLALLGLGIKTYFETAHEETFETIYEGKAFTFAVPKDVLAHRVTAAKVVLRHRCQLLDSRHERKFEALDKIDACCILSLLMLLVLGFLSSLPATSPAGTAWYRDAVLSTVVVIVIVAPFALSAFLLRGSLSKSTWVGVGPDFEEHELSAPNPLIDASHMLKVEDDIGEESSGFKSSSPDLLEIDNPLQRLSVQSGCV